MLLWLVKDLLGRNYLLPPTGSSVMSLTLSHNTNTHTHTIHTYTNQQRSLTKQLYQQLASENKRFCCVMMI